MICALFQRPTVKPRTEPHEDEFEDVEMLLAIADPPTLLSTTGLMFCNYLGSRWVVVSKLEG
jgi:hypothetical protein